MKPAEFINNVVKASNGMLTKASAKKHLVDTIVKGSYGYLENDITFIVKESVFCGMDIEDGINFFEQAILPKMSINYQTKYKIGKLNKTIKIEFNISSKEYKYIIGT